MRKPLSVCTLAAALLAPPALAHHAGERLQAGDVAVSHAWMRPNAAMAHAGAVYLTLENTGDAPDRLVAAEAAFATGVVFVAPVIDDGGVLTEREVEAIRVLPGQTLTLGPGGPHLVFQGLQRRFAAGEHVDVTLTFERGGEVAIEVEVEAPDDEDHGHDETS